MAETNNNNTTRLDYTPKIQSQSNFHEKLNANLVEITAFSEDVFSYIEERLKDEELILILKTAQEAFIATFKTIVNSLKFGFSGKATGQLSTTVVQTIKDFFAHQTHGQNYNQLTSKIMSETKQVLSTTKQNLVQRAPIKQQGSMIFNVLTPLENQMITTCNQMLLQIEQLLAQSEHHQSSNLFNMTAPSNTELPVETHPAKAK